MKRIYDTFGEYLFWEDEVEKANKYFGTDCKTIEEIVEVVNEIERNPGIGSGEMNRFEVR